MTLLDALQHWVTQTSDPWATDHAVRRAAATATLRDELAGLANMGDRDAARVWEEWQAEETYAATNAAAGDPMHRKVPEYALVVHPAIARLEADAYQPQPGDTLAWCPTCRRRRVVEEASDESAYEGNHEVYYWVQRLGCGHQLQSEGRIIGRSPGGEAVAEALTGDAARRRVEHTHAAAERHGDL